MNTTEIAKLDPKEFGLEESNVQTIEQAFQPKIIERDALVPAYEELIKKEITPELCQEFKAMRLKLVKVRTGIAEIHKTQKAYFLAAGRFVDAWKNKETAPIEQMEEKLKEGEEYFERLEAKRIADLEAERTALLEPYTDIIPQSLGLLSEEAFTTYLTGAKVAHEARIEAEKAEAERQAQIALRKERDDNRFKIFAGTGLIFADGIFAKDEDISYNFSELCELDDDDFVVKVQEAIDKIAECKAAEIKEKERLAAIAKAKEKELEEERKKAEEEKKKQDKTLRAQQEKAAAEKKRQDEIIAKQKAELEAKQKQELEAKQSEEKRIADEKAEADRLAKAPKKEKLTKWIDDLALTAPEGLDKDAVVVDILAKFTGFKKWAKGEVDKL
jgi:hypothetical protein